MLFITGISIIVTVLALILSKKTSALTALIIIPVLGAIIAGFGTETAEFAIEGIRNIAPVAAMFIFAILFFGILTDAGMFDPVINGILNAVGNDPVKIVMGTAMLSMMVHLDVPVARNPGGSEITGIIRVEFAPSAGTRPMELPLCGNVYNSGHIAYTPDRFPYNEGYILTYRKKESDPRRLIPNSDWAFATTSMDNSFPGTPDSTKVSLRDGFDSDYLYELVYTAKNPKVMGVGLAAVREIVNFFRNEEEDAKGIKNPVAEKIKYAIGTGTSQSGNFMKTFIHLGFNESLEGEKVFDAVFPIVGARQTNINMRFAVPGGGGGPRTDNKAFGQTSVRAFAADYYDDISGHQGGIFTRSSQSNTTPKVFMLLTSSEMWALQGSAAFTDAYGQKDLEQPDELRIYYIAGAQHSIRSYGSVNRNTGRTVYPGSSLVDGSDVLKPL